MYSSRKIEDLSPEMQALYYKWKELLDKEKIDFIITSTLRDQECQNALYLQGRGAPGKIVTWTLNSKHISGNAFDFCIMNNGRCDWGMVLRDNWNKAVEIGKSLGMSQVVDKNGKVKEFAHLQI